MPRDQLLLSTLLSLSGCVRLFVETRFSRVIMETFASLGSETGTAPGVASVSQLSSLEEGNSSRDFSSNPLV